MQRLPSGAGMAQDGPATANDARLQGFNLGDWLVAGASASHLDGFISQGDFDRLVNWRFSHVRLPVDNALLETAAGWLALDRALLACSNAGLRCVLALRLHPAERAGLFASERWTSCIARWEALARRYADAPDFLYYDLLDRPAAPDDLSPETLTALGAIRLSPAAARRPALPGATGARAWNALVVKLTEAIRAQDTRHTLVVQSNGASPGAFAHLRPTRDPHTLYSFHCFEPRVFTKQGTVGQAAPAGAAPPTYPGMVAGERWDRARLQALLEPVLAFRQTYSAPVYLGAFGVSSGAPRIGQLTWLRTVLSLCRANGIGWAYWTYKDGPFGLVGQRGLDYDVLGILQSEA